MPWSPTPTDEQQTGPGWAEDWPTTTTTQVPGWHSTPQPVLTDAEATVVIEATASVVLAPRAPGQVPIIGTAGAETASAAPAIMLGEGSVFPSSVAVDAEGEVDVIAEAFTSTATADPGLPYTLPFIIGIGGGGSPVLEVYTGAKAIVSISATATVELVPDAPADVAVQATATTTSDTFEGLPYEVPFLLNA